MRFVFLRPELMRGITENLRADHRSNSAEEYPCSARDGEGARRPFEGREGPPLRREYWDFTM